MQKRQKLSLMKAIILAAGKGERFGDITKSIPKPLIKLGQLSLIEHNIVLLKEYGYKDIVINVSYLHDAIIDFLGNGDKYNIKIKYSIEVPEPYETGGGIKHALSLLGNQPFLVINSDIYTDFRLSNIVLDQKDLASLVMVRNPNHNVRGDFSISKGRVILKEKNDLTYSGISILDPKIFKNFRDHKFKLIDVFMEQIKNDAVSGQVHDGAWIDIGTPDRLKTAEDLFINN